MTQLSGKVAVITGGGSGIGRSIAKKCAAEGAKVAVFGRNRQKLDATIENMEAAIAVAGDVSKLGELDALFEKTHEAFGKIDVLVASAGVATPAPAQDVTEDAFDTTVDVNYKGLYFTVQRAIPHLNDGASIILISSVAGQMGIRDYSVYGSTKAAVSYLARTFSADLMDRKIRVNSISPGFIDTPMFDTAKEATPELMTILANRVPAKRMGRPEEIAELALFLASPKGEYIVGIDIPIDGGLSTLYPPMS